MASKSDIELWRRPKVSPVEIRQMDRRFWIILLLTACLMGILAAWLMLHDTRELRRLREEPLHAAQEASNLTCGRHFT